MSKRQKRIVFITLLLLLCLLVCNVAYAGIIDKAKSAKDKVVKLIQDVAKVVAAAFIAWAGVIWWGAGGDPQKLAAAKGKLLGFCIALIFIFGAEDIVSTAFDILS